MENKKPDYLTDWQNFYLQYFGIKVDFSNLTIPEKKEGFNRPLFIPLNMLPQTALDASKGKYPCRSKYKDPSLDGVIEWTEEARDPRKGAYVIWIRDSVESDKELKNISADELKEKNIQGITLTERLIYGLKYYSETKKYLDNRTTTLCSGSRDAWDGGVPGVVWLIDEYWIVCCDSDDAKPGRGSREVVAV